MKKVAGLFIIAILLVFSLCHHLGAESWVNVVSDGFGEPNNDYAWSMATFRGKLYVGTLNVLNGAQIWSSSSGETDTWQKVYQSIPGTNLGVRCLYADGNQALYAGTYNSSGAEILMTVDGQRWRPVARGGLGNPGNNSIRCMIRFGNYLYVGTGNSYPPPIDTASQMRIRSQFNIASLRPSGKSFQTLGSRLYGAKLYRSVDGSKWELVKADPGFESTKVLESATNKYVTNNVLIGELAVFNDYLYAFTWTEDATIQTSTQSESRRQYSLSPFIGEITKRASTKPRIPMLGGGPTPGAFEVWRSKDGVQWEKVVGQDDKYGNGMGFCFRDDPSGAPMDNDVVTSVSVFKDQLYLGTVNYSCKPSVWRTADGTQWEKTLDFFALGEPSNLYVWRLIQFRDELFVGVLNMGYVGVPGGTGAQIWVSPSGDTGSFHALVHNGFDEETFTMLDVLTYQQTGERQEIEGYKNYGVRTLGVLNDTLFAGTATVPSMLLPGIDSPWRLTIAGTDIGCEIWKYVP
jgi:hypothetical protein